MSFTTRQMTGHQSSSTSCPACHAMPHSMWHSMWHSMYDISPYAQRSRRLCCSRGLASVCRPAPCGTARASPGRTLLSSSGPSYPPNQAGRPPADVNVALNVTLDTHCHIECHIATCLLRLGLIHHFLREVAEGERERAAFVPSTLREPRSVEVEDESEENCTLNTTISMLM